MSNSFRAFVMEMVPPNSCSSMSTSLKLKLAFSVGMPPHICCASRGIVLPGHCEQFAGFLQVSVARQYSFSAAAQVTGEFETVAMPPRLESNLSCISIQTCMLPIFAFLFDSNLGHFLAHFFLRVTLSFPTDAVFQLDSAGTMLSNMSKCKTYLYLLLECLPKPVKLNTLPCITTAGSVTSNAPGAFHRTVNLTVRRMHVSFWAH
mmetsp:Transcript_18171/g.29547  ORF Transcript_18171/g.29547 Transcript_18171/m.29547 type:complete len:205 (+) Transcript_18171:496-1110(+)